MKSLLPRFAIHTFQTSFVLGLLIAASPPLAAGPSPHTPAAPHATELTNSGLVTDPDLILPTPDMSKPDYLVPFVDPDFNTTITRIADDEGETYTVLEDGAQVQHTWGQHSRHHYSDIQPWNSDGSLIEVQVSGGQSVVFLDGNSYQPKYGKCDNYDYYDARWNPAPGHENEQIDVHDGYLYWFNVVTCEEVKKIKLPSTNMSYIGGGKGNVSRDGRYVVLAYHRNDDDHPDAEDHPKLYLLDMLGTGDNGSPGRFGPALDVPVDDCGDTERGCELSWAGLSPSMKYVVAHYHHDYTRVYDVDLDTLSLTVRPMPADSPECPPDVDGAPLKRYQDGYIFDTGHADTAINPADGEDVMVGLRRGWCKQAYGDSLGQIVMVRLKDNKVTGLTNPDGEEYAYHVSARNTALPGWVYVGYRNPIDKDSGEKNRPWARFTDELVAISLESRPEQQIVRRLAHLHSTGYPYDNEAHSVPSPDGRRVIFASAWNWGCDPNQGDQGCGAPAEPASDSNSVQDYVVDLRPLLPTCPGGDADAIFCDGFEAAMPTVGRGL